MLKFLTTCLESEKPPPPLNRERINSFIINQCMDFPIEKLEKLIDLPDSLLKILYGYKSCRNIPSLDSLFVRKLFHSPREEFRKDLWYRVSHLLPDHDENFTFLRNLCSICGMDVFTSSLKFTSAEVMKTFASGCGFRCL
ncbi:unnamed protein product, partial [Allacma fusca]